MLKQMFAAGAIGALALVSACNSGTAEKTGENMDSAIEEATQGHENLGDGPFEQAGEAIDESGGAESSQDAADAISDATDGDPSTTP